MKLAYMYTGGRLRRQARIEKGEAAADFLHGSEQMRQRGHTVDLYELSGMVPPSGLKVAGDVLCSLKLLPHKTDGELLGQAWEMLPRLQEYDAVLVSGSPACCALALWKCMGFLKPEIIAIQCGMLNYPFSPMQRFVTRRLQGHMWTMLYAQCEYDPYCRFVGRRYEHRVSVNEFAADTRFWTPASDNMEGDYIFSIGNDGRRDYDLLMRVGKALQLPIIVVTRANIREQIPANVHVMSGDFRTEILSDLEIRELYRRAKVVVVPLTPSLQPSGQSVCIQAMACGKAVVLSDTAGLWSRKKLKNGENIFIVPAQDEGAMVRLLSDIYCRRDVRDRVGQCAYDTVRREWTLERYAERIEDVCHMALEKRRR